MRLLTEFNNNLIGPLFVGTALLFFLLAGVLALIIRAHLAFPGLTIVHAATYNQLFTMHGTVMMFLFAVPAVEAVAITLLPAMVGARELPFPRTRISSTRSAGSASSRRCSSAWCRTAAGSCIRC